MIKPSSETMLSFYQQLGRVFYGIAAADAVVRDEEVELLDSIVQNYWLPLEKVFDEFNTDAAYQIEIVFAWLNSNDWDKENILENFVDFKSEHSKLFTPKNNTLILDTAEAIADSFHGINKAELSYLKKLKNILMGSDKSSIPL